MNKVWGPMNSAMDEISTEKANPKRALDKAVKTIKKDL
jgi:arabinogalactan oligomer/maltooligosaccharide transport system substrate-binding protein